ncbi:MAG: glycosyltransferase family 9 protein [Desulfovibrio sp.]|nr:MAG: glycosyltransferase family 9 protein [Desulfovibrio sp.]
MCSLLINLTRFGDLIQTQPVLSGLAARKQALDLVCLQSFSSAAELLRDVDHIWPLEGDQLLQDLDRNWLGSLSGIWNWSKQVAEGRGVPDHHEQDQAIYNVTPSMSARLMARLVSLQGGQAAGMPPPQVHGFSMDDLGFGASDTPWAMFLLASSDNRAASPFNLSDVLWKAAGLGDAPRPLGVRRPGSEGLKDARELMQQKSPTAKGFVAMQLGASNDTRRWPVASFARLGQALWREHELMPVLVGGKSETHLGRRFQDSGAPCINLMGQTSLKELAAVLAQVECLVSNDTGTMHLAAGLGTPMAALFLATAQPWDTGPYLPGAICVEPDMACHPCGFDHSCPQKEACRKAITPELIQSLVVGRILGQDKASKGKTAPGARIWETCWDSHHFHDLRSLSGHEITDRTQWLRVQRRLYSQFLDQRGLDDIEGDTDQWRPELSRESRSSALETLGQANKVLDLLKEQAVLLTANPAAPIKNVFLASWRRVGEIFSASPLFSALDLMWNAQSQESGRDMASISQHIANYSSLVSAWSGLLK